MLAADISALALLCGILGVVLRIAYQTGHIITRFDEHVSRFDRHETHSSATHLDMETRMRVVERRAPGRPV